MKEITIKELVKLEEGMKVWALDEADNEFVEHKVTKHTETEEVEGVVVTNIMEMRLVDETGCYWKYSSVNRKDTLKIFIEVE